MHEIMLAIRTVLVCFFTVPILGCANWTIISPPIIFEKTARLGCEADNETEQSTRTWLGGPDYTTISHNGYSSNPKKYMEVTARKPFRSILEIYHFSEDDVDCDYSCSIGFCEARNTLSLKPEDFEFHPTKAYIAAAATLNKGNLGVHFMLLKVYPKPKCKILFQGIDYREQAIGNIEKSGKLFRAQITLDHTFETQVCKGHLHIKCTVGNSDFDVFSKDFHTCPDKHEKEETSIVVYIFAVFGCILFIILLVSICFISRLRNPMCCNINNTGNAAADMRVTGEDNILLGSGKVARSDGVGTFSSTV